MNPSVSESSPGRCLKKPVAGGVWTCPMRMAMIWSLCGSGRTGAAPAGAAVVASAATETATASSVRRCRAVFLPWEDDDAP
jgi:hypothetical protein